MIKKLGIPILTAAALLGCTLSSSALVTLTADPADYGFSPAMFTLDPELYNPAGRGVAGTRQLRQSFQLSQDVDVSEITIGWTMSGNDGGIIINFYEVADVSASPFTPGTLVHTITIGTEVDLPSTGARVRINLSGSDVFSLPQRDTGTEGYAIEISNADGSTTLGNLRHSNDGTEHYTSGRFYTESGNPSGTGRDLGISLAGALVSPFPDLNWAKGNGTWDISTTANWDDGVGAAVYQETNSLGNHVTFEDSVSAGGSITVTLDTLVSPASITVDTTNTYTITGNGNINGPGTITKTGSGTLVLDTYNGFTGPVNLNEGTLALGSGGFGVSLGNSDLLTLNGGTVLWESGVTEDISLVGGGFPRTVYLAADTTLDTGANTVGLGASIGSGGVGGVTKVGSGTLNLGAVNDYSGNTVVSEGILGLGGSGSLSNSAAILVNSGATLDSYYNEVTLNGGNNQILAGAGTVAVYPLIAPAGATVTPGTNGVAETLTFGRSGFGDGGLTLDGGSLAMDISAAGPNDLVVVNGNLSLDGGTVDLNVSGVLPNGTYPLINYTGFILSGGPGALVVNGFSQAGQIAFLSSAVSGRIDLIVATAGDADLVWQGSGGNVWDVEGAANWLSNGISVKFLQGDSVTFNATGAGQPTVDLQGALFPDSLTVDATSDYTLMTSAGGKFSGNVGLTKNNSGTLTILTDNNNTGVNAINGGTVQVGDGSATSHLGDGGFMNDGTLIFNHADGDNRAVGPISGSGSLTKNGNSVLTIAGDATYTGATTIGSGASLSFGNGGALAAIATSAINNDGTVIYNSSSDQTLVPAITGSGGLTKRGTGSLTVNTLGMGDTAVEGGTLVLGVEDILGGALDVSGAGAVLDLNGFDQSVATLTGTGGAGVITNTAASGTNTLTINSTADGTMNLQINDGENNVIALVKTGAGILTRSTMAGSSTYSGGTLIMGPGGFNLDEDDQLGTGPVIFDGGLITMNDQDDLINPVIVLSEANYEARGNMQFRGPFTGDANAVVNMFGNADNHTMTFDPGATMDDFFGTMRYSGSNSPVIARFRGDLGGPQVTFDMGTNGTYFLTRNGQTVTLGNLIADANSSMRGATSSDDPTTYVIGGKNLPIDFPGTIADQVDALGPLVNLNRYVGITKDGTNTLTLSGTNMYSGPTTVNGGSLNVTVVGGLDNSRAIIVNSPGVLDLSGMGGTLTLGATTNAQTVGGNGTIDGNVVASSTSVVTVAPGSSAGELTINGSLTLATNSVVAMELDTSATPTSDKITATSITAAGTLTVTNIGPILEVGQVFTLFSQAVSGLTWDGTGSGVLADYTFNDNIASDGTIEVASVVPKFDLTQTNITATPGPGAGELTLGWPLGHTGWILQVQTNALAVGLSSNWFDVADSGTTNMTTVPISTDEAVFYRLRLP